MDFPQWYIEMGSLNIRIKLEIIRLDKIEAQVYEIQAWQNKIDPFFFRTRLINTINNIEVKEWTY